MDIKNRQKAVLAAFKEQVEKAKWDVGEVSVSKDRVSIACPDGTSAVIHLATVKRGYEKGEFGAYLGLMLDGGPIYEVMRDANVQQDIMFSEGRIFTGSSHDLMKTPSSVYPFTAGVEVDKQVRKMVSDVGKKFIPIIKMFTKDYGDAVKFVMEEPGYLTKPFCVGVVLLGLAGRLDDVDKLIKHARKREDFWDFHQVDDPQQQIVKPIKAVVSKRK